MRDQQERYDSCEEKYDTWLMTFPFPTKESLVEYAVLLSAPVITYYNNLFLTNTGDNYALRETCRVCQLFDPFFLKGKENQLCLLYNLADNLSVFQYTQFNPTFIARLKGEIPEAVRNTNMPFDWNAIGVSKQFETRLQKRRLRHSLVRESRWEDDPGERANKIWV